MMAELTESEELRQQLVREKHEQARALLRAHGVDCWLTFTREGSDPLLPLVIGSPYIAGVSALMVFADGPSVAVVADYDVGQAEGVFEQTISYSLDWKPALRDALAARDPKSIGLNISEHDHGSDGLTVGLQQALAASLVGTPYADRLVSAEAVAATVRAVKTRSEIERIRRACEITQRIFDDVTDMLKPGLTEFDIAEIIRERMTTYGVAPAWTPSLCPAVFSLNRQAGHSPPGMTRIEAGEGVRVDFGVVYEGYVSDMQRTWYIGSSQAPGPPAQLAEQFQTLYEAVQLAASLLKPGVRGYEVDELVRAFLEERGHRFSHALGHQIGLQVHDGGVVLGPRNARYADRSGGVIEAGMIFTLEPSVGVVALEDDVVVTGDGCSFLVPSQRAIYGA